MKIIIGILSGIVALAIGFVLLGVFAEPKFEGEITGTINAPVEKVYRHLLDLKSIPKYRKEVTEVIADGKNEKGYPIWREGTDMGGYIHFEMLDQEENTRVRLQMKESSFGMKGIWEYRLKAEGTKTKIQILESSENSSVWIRSIFSIVGRNANLKKELEILNQVFP